MPKASPGILGFSTGLNSPSTTGRIDLETYPFGCLVLDNFLVEVEGPITKRPGAKYIVPAKYDDRTTRLFDFVFSDEQPYQLEFGDQYMRVHRLQSTVLDPGAGKTATILTITAANPMVLTTSGHSILVGDHVFVIDTSIAEINEAFFRVTAVTASDLTVEFDSSSLTAQTVAAGTAQAVYEIVTPYATADIRTIKTAPSIDVMYPVSPNVLPQKLIRLADDNWTIAPIWNSTNLQNDDDDALGLWPPFGELQIRQSIELSIAADVAPGATTTVTATAALFVVGDIGRYLKIQGSTPQSGFGEITAFTDDLNVTVTVKSRYPSDLFPGNLSKAWSFDAFTSVDGFPRAISFFEDRLFFGGTSELPQSWWASVSGGFENFRPYADDGSGGFTIAADSSIFNTIASDKQNPIEWLLGQETLFAGTRGGEFTIEGANIEQGIQPGNLFVKKRASFGSRKDVQAVAVDTVVLFCQRAGRRVRELAYRLENDRYFAPDMNRMSREAVFGRITEMSYQQEPNRVLWCRMEDGTFASFTYEREEQVTAWATQHLGGEDVFIESVSVIPSIDDDEDEVWVCVKRTFNGTTSQTIELFSDFWDRTQVQEDALFMDSALCFELVSATVVQVGFIFLLFFAFTEPPTAFVVGDILEVSAVLAGDEASLGALYLVVGLLPEGVLLQDVNGVNLPNFEAAPPLGSTLRLTTTSVTGALHLANQTVGLTLEGTVQADVTVSPVGVVTLPRPAGQGCVGHRYDARMQTNRLEAGAADGIAQGKTKRITRAVVRLDQTGPGLYLGSTFDDPDAVFDLIELQRFQTIIMDQAIPLFDGDTESLAMPEGYNQAGTIALRHSDPLPCTIIAIFPQLITQDR